MARLINSTFGDIRGSVGGTTFSRNKSGAIMRNKIKPTNRNTTVQINNRAAIASITQTFKNITATQQAQWAAFASDGNRFNPMRKMNTGGLTGFNAFLALNKTIDTVNRKQSANSKVTFPCTPTPIVGNIPADGIYPHLQDPPYYTVSGNLMMVAPGTGTDPLMVYMTLGIPTLDLTSGKYTVPVNLSELCQNATFASFLDENATQFGFYVFGSDPVLQNGNRPKNDYFRTLGIIPPATIDTPADVSNISYFTLEGDYASGQSFKEYVKDNWIKVTVFVVSSTGTVKLLGAQYCKVTA